MYFFKKKFITLIEKYLSWLFAAIQFFNIGQKWAELVGRQPSPNLLEKLFSVDSILL